MAERSIAAVLKTVELQGSGGSNPSSSATSGCENARSPKRPGCGEENERAAKSGKPVCRYPIPYSARYARGGAMQQRIRAGLTASSVTCPLPARNIFRIIWRSRGWKTRNTTLRSACNMPEESPGSRKTRSVARRSPIPCPTARKADAFPAGCRDDARLQSAAQPRTMFRARPEIPRKRMKTPSEASQTHCRPRRGKGAAAAEGAGANTVGNRGSPSIGRRARFSRCPRRRLRIRRLRRHPRPRSART